MSNTKTVMSQASNQYVAPLDITDVFSTYLYDGNGVTGQTINNGIDLDGEGGLVWFKQRNAARDHGLFDTVRGANKYVISNDTNVEATSSTMLTAFNSNGFTLGGGGAIVNNGSGTYASWTFRKASKFFDMVTYTGNGTSQTISHNLGTNIGFMVVKKTSGTGHWIAWHKDLADTAQGRLLLNLSSSYNFATSYWNNTAPTSSGFTVGSNANTNESGSTYVAYLFAHNDGDGGFGPSGDQDIIKCGSYVSHETSPPEITLGFEPQWVLIKKTTGTDEWAIFDNMRGVATGGLDSMLRADLTSVEYSAANQIDFTSTGFKLTTAGLGVTNAPTGQTYIYMAIRRGPLAPPTAGTEVFAAVTRDSSVGGVNYHTGFPVDLSIFNARTAPGNYFHARLTSAGRLQSINTAAEISGDTVEFQSNVGYQPGASSTTTNALTWNWKRAPGYFDVVSWNVDGTGDQTIKHNLGVVPEMVWSKNRNTTSNTYNWWVVAHKDLTGWDSANENDRHVLRLNTNAASAQQGYHRDFTDTSIRMLGVASGGYTTTDSVIAYLFGTVAGVSKVGSFSHTYGGTTNVDCGFTSGARFVLWKRTDGARHWEVFDTTRGIVAGNDAYLRLSSNSAETSGDYIDPYSAGFSVGSALGTGDFIFYAIA